MEKVIMIIDDEKMITDTLSLLIKMTMHCKVEAYNDPVQALQSVNARESSIDLVISDFMMPGMNGIEFLKNVKEKCPDTVTMMLTGYADKESAIRCINEIGLYYYIEKPWDNKLLIKIIENAIEKKELVDNLKKNYGELKVSNDKIKNLYEELNSEYQQEISRVKNLIISLANVIEAKDKYTEGHVRRVASISGHLGEGLGMDAEQIEHIEMAATIHDIGKVGVSENILNKPGKLTDEEFEQMKKHTIIGENICKPLTCFQMCFDAIRHHHEKLDGSGYPDGLSGDNVSQEARIIAVADIFDALYSKRPYRDKLQIEKVKEIMFGEAEDGKLDIGIVKLLFDLVDRNKIKI